MRCLWIPRPTHFLGLFDLQNGAELVLLSLLLNKLSGVFGVLAIFTGAEISALQFSMYTYSLFLFGILLALAPHIHKRSSLSVLSFAYLYLLDSLINGLYTVVFGISWFLVLSASHLSAVSPISNAGQTIDQTSGFTTPEANVSRVEVLAYPAENIANGQDAVAVGIPASAPPNLGLGSGVMQPESATSIFIISLFWMIRIYFVLIVFSYAREVVRSSATPAEDAFEGRNGGEGWKGRLGRALISVNRGYWDGSDGYNPLGTKFRRSTEDEERRTGGNGHRRVRSLEV